LELPADLLLPVLALQQLQALSSFSVLENVRIIL
jgi:hypothetical protein